MEQLQVVRGRLALRDQGVLQPLEEAAPVRGAVEDHREAGHLLRLHQGERLEQLVQGAEAAGQNHEALRVLHEHRLADEEVTEVQPEVDELVEALLEGQLDAEPDAEAAGLGGAAVGSLHGTRAAAGDHRVAGLGEGPADGHAGLVLG